ncbi:MAG: UDP-N-acetylmuramoyl-L-alanine--D-glutamate ligase [Bacteroidales bacterium]
MINDLKKFLNGKRILILGFGLEGRSTYAVLNKIVRPEMLGLADRNADVFDDSQKEKHQVFFGENYLIACLKYDLIIKSPGIPESVLPALNDNSLITSQTNLFLTAFSKQTIGITGTKGKSTTSSLIYHILKKYTNDCVLVGNIGKPPFDYIESLTGETVIVYEMSAHQLVDVKVSPHIAIILNVFEEHLDHYNSFQHYIQAKLNIGAHQTKNDFLILNGDDPILKGETLKEHASALISFSQKAKNGDGAFVKSDNEVILNFENQVFEYDFSNRSGLPGSHNLNNIMAAVCACHIIHVPEAIINEAVNEFKGLEHRLEYVGEFGAVHFYNDSISTIPEATIAALKTLGKVNTLILGGKDRGINYQILIDYIKDNPVENLLFTGPAGKRMMELFENDPGFEGKTYFVEHFAQMEPILREMSKPGGICLLSPAASSYDQFKNFEERGRLFKKIAGNFMFPAS